MKKMTKTELIVELKKKGIKGYSKLKRDEMEELLNKNTAPTQTEKEASYSVAKEVARVRAMPLAEKVAYMKAKTQARARAEDMDIITSSMGNMGISKQDKEMNDMARRCAMGGEKKPNLALGQQTIQCGLSTRPNSPRRYKQRIAQKPIDPSQIDKDRFKTLPPELVASRMFYKK